MALAPANQGDQLDGVAVFQRGLLVQPSWDDLPVDFDGDGLFAQAHRYDQFADVAGLDLLGFAVDNQLHGHTIGVVYRIVGIRRGSVRRDRVRCAREFFR